MDVLLNIAPNIAGFVAFVLTNTPDTESSLFARISYGLLFSAFCAYCMVAWIHVLFKMRSDHPYGILLFCIWNNEQRFEFMMLFLSWLGNMFFYLGMLFQLWDIHAMTYWARWLITGITGLFVLSVMIAHLLLMKTCFDGGGSRVAAAGGRKSEEEVEEA